MKLWTLTRAAPPVFPFPGHRNLGEVMADEAVMRRAFAKSKRENAAKAARWREQRRDAA